ncbi:glycosyl hydrolase family 95 catalytic domain-containing protein [Parapedobacter soli]|uniref:glycosyl hydrolase family 95 catalytic domain-containing protein n=1 Tax=Parapedobacter soli TaxID=416955 RepID=UPI0021C6CCCA|nr:glycoside hydrolase [Parapedobacter soli]
MKKIRLTCWFTVLLYFIPAHLPAQSVNEGNNSPLIQVDYEKLVGRADLHYKTPVQKSEEGQPIGNGVMGSLVWTTPSQIRMQINRVDVFGNNSTSNNFYQRNTEYGGGLGWVDIDFGTSVFSIPHYSQHLSCYNGISTISGDGIKATATAWQHQDVLAVHINDSRSAQPFKAVNLRMLRLPTVKNGNHTAVSSLKHYGDQLVLVQEFREDDYYCTSAIAISVLGDKAISEQINEMTLRLLISPSSKETTVFVASAASFDPNEDVEKLALNKLALATTSGFNQIVNSNQQWWRSFWERSYIYLNSEDGEADFIEQNYTYYLYVMASSSRGKYPTKFNGMLWATGGDIRQWGNAFWGANQGCLYNALFPTNHIALLDPLFNMYSSVYPTLETAASQQWGSKGIYIPETMGHDGVPELPDNIAKELRALYLLQMPWEERSDEFMAYANTKIPFLSRWNWKHTGQWDSGTWTYVERGDGPFGPVNHIFSRGAKIAYQYWQKYEYTLDENWLREHAYPMLKGMVEFYRHFPNLKKEEDGKYHISHVNDNESLWRSKDPVEEISSMRGIIPALIKASERLGVDEDMRPVWQEFLSNLAPLATNTSIQGESKQPEVWVGALNSTSPVRGNAKRLPDRNTMPIWYFDLGNPGANPKDWRIANNTFDAYFPNGLNKDHYPYVLSKLAITGAILGRSDAVKYLLPNQLRRDPKDEVMPNRMDLSEGFFTTNIQRLGRGAEALHAALCFNAPPEPGSEPIIRVFHAWPQDWNASFRLLTRNNILVSSAIKNGAVNFIELSVQGNRGADLVNPWKGSAVAVYRNGKREGFLRGEVLTVKASQGDRIVLVKRGDDPLKYKQNLTTL